MSLRVETIKRNCRGPFEKRCGSTDRKIIPGPRGYYGKDGHDGNCGQKGCPGLKGERGIIIKYDYNKFVCSLQDHLCKITGNEDVVIVVGGCAYRISTENLARALGRMWSEY